MLQLVWYPGGSWWDTVLKRVWSLSKRWLCWLQRLLVVATAFHQVNPHTTERLDGQLRHRGTAVNSHPLIGVCILFAIRTLLAQVCCMTDRQNSSCCLFSSSWSISLPKPEHSLTDSLFWVHREAALNSTWRKSDHGRFCQKYGLEEWPYKNFFKNLIQFNVKLARVQTKSTKANPNSIIPSQSLYRRVFEFSLMTIN